MTVIEGSAAVVTGGASGIGRGIAEEFIARGGRVVIADIDADRVHATAEEIGAIPAVVDVSSAASVAELAERSVRELGGVDIVVNNAGVGPVGEIASLTLDDWRWMLDVNLWGVIHGIHAFLPILLANERGGHLVTTTSFATFNPLPGLGAYTAAKAATQAISETLALELADRVPRIGVTIMPPGPVLTSIRDSVRSRPLDQVGALRDADLVAEASDLRWIDARTAGWVVARAVEADDAYAITHPEWWSVAQARIDRIRAEFDRYPPRLGD